jgi:hypothetical protein
MCTNTVLPPAARENSQAGAPYAAGYDALLGRVAKALRISDGLSYYLYLVDVLVAGGWGREAHCWL